MGYHGVDAMQAMLAANTTLDILAGDCWTAQYLALRQEMGAPAAFLQRARRLAGTSVRHEHPIPEDL